MNRAATEGWPARAQHPRTGRGGFTLVEVMLVIAIMGVVAAIGIPTIFQAARKSPMREAVADVQEACRTARMLAILQGKTMEIVIKAQDGQMTVQPVTERQPGATESVEPAASDAPTKDTEPPKEAASLHFSAKLPDSIAFKRLLVNLRDQMEFDEARIHFYPNGTCDAFTATLLSEQNEERNVILEITTAREHVEVVR